MFFDLVAQKKEAEMQTVLSDGHLPALGYHHHDQTRSEAQSRLLFESEEPFLA